MVDVSNAQTLMEGELEMERKGSFAARVAKPVDAILQPHCLMFKMKQDKRWTIVEIRNVTGIQLETNKRFVLDITMNKKRTLMRFYSKEARKWVRFSRSNHLSLASEKKKNSHIPHRLQDSHERLHLPLRIQRTIGW